MKTVQIIALALNFLSVSSVAISSNLNSGLVAHWSFDNDNGNNIMDASMNNFNGISSNLSYEAGPVSKAAVFNGINSRIYFPDNNTAPPGLIANLSLGTISLWFRFQNIGADILPLFYFGESDENMPHNSLILEIGHSQDPSDRRLYLTIVNKKFCYDSGKNLAENTWYHFAAVVSSTGNTGYLNGEEISDRRYNLGSNATYSDFFADVPEKKLLTLGYGRYGRNKSFFNFKGGLDDVRIYDRPLNESEVKELYAMGSATEVPTSYEIHPQIQIYPNPIYLEATIEWDSPVYCHTIISIYDVIGRKIETLVNDYRHPGSFTFVFNAGNNPPGIYFLIIQIGDFIETRRIRIQNTGFG